MGLIYRSWDPATVSALAAIFGSFAGAFASTLSAWITQRHHERRDLLAKKDCSSRTIIFGLHQRERTGHARRYATHV